MTKKGKHLIIDGHVSDGEVLSDPGRLIEMFDELVTELGMKYLQRPSAYRVALNPDNVGTDEDDGGWSVFCQITTSHIALHGWPLRRAFMMDIFSCKDFDHVRARSIVNGRLGAVETCTTVIDREA